MEMEGLDHEQQQDYQKYLGIKTFFSENQTKVDLFLPLKDEQTDFETNLGDVIPLAGAKTVNTTGLTEGKVALKQLAADAYGIFVPVAKGYCIKKNLPELAANLNYTSAKLMKMDDGKVLETCEMINEIITTELIPLPDFAPYNITVPVLTAALAKATAFNDSRGKAKSKEAHKASKAEQLEAVFDKLHENNEQFTLLMNNFRESDTEFYLGYLAVNVEVDFVKHTGISGVVTNAQGEPVNNAEIVNKKSGRKVKTDLLAEYDHEPNKPGLTEFECSAPGHQPVKKIVKLQRGKTIEMNWTLSPQTS